MTIGIIELTSYSICFTTFLMFNFFVILLQLVKELIPNTFFSDQFVTSLKKSPIVIMFTPMNELSVTSKLLREVIIFCIISVLII